MGDEQRFTADTSRLKTRIQSVIPKLISIRGAKVDQKVEIPTGRDVFLLLKYFPGLQDISSLWSAFRLEKQGWPSRSQWDSINSSHDKAAVFHHPIELSVFFCVCALIQFEALLLLWKMPPELSKHVKKSESSLKEVYYIPQPVSPHDATMTIFFACVGGWKLCPEVRPVILPSALPLIYKLTSPRQPLSHRPRFITHRLPLLLLPLVFKMIIDL